MINKFQIVDLLNCGQTIFHAHQISVLRFACRFKAPNGANFDLLADDQLKNFFIKLNQLWTGTYSFHDGEPSDCFRSRFKKIFIAKIHWLIGEGQKIEEVVALDDVKSFLDTEVTDWEKIFPADIFKVVATPIPKRAVEVSNVETVFNTGETDKADRIFIFNDGERNLVSIFDINRLTTKQEGKLHSQIVNAALLFDLFHDKKTDNYFIDLRNVKSFLQYVDGSEKLLQRFNSQVFMTPTPAVSTILNLNCKFFSDAYFNGKTFNIYKGVGFAENAFFCNPNDLFIILDLSADNEGALYEAIYATGEFWDNTQMFCRLDFVPYITRHCLARLWNGSNQDHPIIKNGWAFIHWFKDFLPKFYEQHVPILCGAQGIPDSYFELNDTPTHDDSLKTFFATFDRACNNFKNQILEAHHE